VGFLREHSLFVIASPCGRGNPLGGVVSAARASVGLPRRAVALLAMTRCGVQGGCGTCVLDTGTITVAVRLRDKPLTHPFCHCEPYKAWQYSPDRRGRLPMFRLDCRVAALLAMTEWGRCFRWIAASGCRPPRNDKVWDGEPSLRPAGGLRLLYCDSSMTAQQVAQMEMNWSLPWGKELSKYF
jgi:hypothetical protein